MATNFGDLLDFLLRNHEAFFRGLFEAQQVGTQALILIASAFVLLGIYGLAMGAPGGLRQSISSAVKVPILFLISLIVCFPALFVITVLIGSKLSMIKMVTMILFAIGVSSILLASFATVAAFFAITGSGYDFMKVFHVSVFSFSGIWGMAVLWKGLAFMLRVSDLYPESGRLIMLIWIAIYAFVGAQMAWALRPFIGEPKLPFELFRRRGSDLNFYTSVLISMQLMKGRATRITAQDDPKRQQPVRAE
ncbi:MAG: actin-binding WH2 domain-containing protein [bacterium]